MSIFFPRRSTKKRAVQSDLSSDHVPGAAAVAQKGENGGAVSKTSVNNTEEEYSEREESGCRVLVSLVSERRFILTCS